MQIFNNQLNQIGNQISSTSTSSVWNGAASLADQNSITTVPYYWSGTITSGNTQVDNTPLTNSSITQTLKNLPPILKVVNIHKTKYKNKLEIEYKNLFGLKNPEYLHLFDPPAFKEFESLVFSNDLWGVFSKSDFYYWEHIIVVEFEDADLAYNILSKKSDILFTTANNWDEKITNEEVISFLNNINLYKRYAHIKLEQLLNEDYPDLSGSGGLYYHVRLDNILDTND